jgi:hypothetical protein
MRFQGHHPNENIRNTKRRLQEPPRQQRQETRRERVARLVAERRAKGTR